MPKLTSAQREAPCPCGSGDKVKDCCKGKPKKKPSEAEQVGLIYLMLEQSQLQEARTLAETLIAGGSRNEDARAALVMVELQEGHIDVAETRLREVFTDPATSNAHAGGLLAQVLIMKGRREEATAIADALLARAPSRGDQVLALVGALNLLERDRDIVTAVSRIDDHFLGTFHYAAGVAHFNLGEHAAARTSLREAVRIDGDEGGGDQRRMHDIVHGAPLRAPWRLDVLTMSDVLPGSAAMALAQLGSERRFVDDEHASAVIARVARTGLVYAPALELVDAMFTVLTGLHPAVALRELRLVWESQMLNEDSRHHAIRLALAAGLIDDNTSITLSLDGQQTTTTVAALNTGSAGKMAMPAAFVLSAEHEALMMRALQQQDDDEPELAMQTLRELEAALPGHPVVRTHQLVVRHANGELDDDQAVQGLRAVIEVAPSLFVARELLARMLFEQLRFDEVEAVIGAAQLEQVSENRQHGVVHSYLTRSAQRRRQHEAAREHAVLALTYLGIAGLEHSAPDVLRLAAFELDEHRQLVDGIADPERLARVVAADAPTAVWYEHLDVEEVDEMLALLRTGTLSKSAKKRNAVDAARGQLVVAVEDGERFQAWFARAQGAVRACVDTLLENGGRLPWEQALRLNIAASSDLDDQFHFSPLGQAMAAGIVVLANVDGAAVAIMPPVVLQALRA